MILVIPDPPFMLPEPLGSMVQTLVWPLFYWTGIIAGPEAIFVFLVALLLAPLYVGAAIDFIRLRQLQRSRTLLATESHRLDQHISTQPDP